MADATKKEKVVYGLKNVHYASLDRDENGAVTYGTPKSFPGAVSLALTADSETVEFYADNMIYYSTSENNGYTGDIEMANIPDDFKKDVFNEVVEDGMQYELADKLTNHIALLGEFDTDAVAKKIVLYDVLCSRPDVSQKTREKSKTPQTQKMSIVARPIEINGKTVVKGSTTPEMAEATYKDFFKQVIMPKAETTAQ